MLDPTQTLLVLVDIQGKLAQLVHEKEALFRNLRILVPAARLLNVPILWLEQNPAGLGPTIPELAELLVDHQPIAKMSFSACGSDRFLEALRSSGRRQVLLAGIEAHVCIYLTASDLLSAGYEVQILSDATSSRSPHNKQIGLELARSLGARITCTETVLFELLRTADAPLFKPIVKLLR